MIRVDFIKHVRDVELLLGAHEEVEVREGKLHVLRVANAVCRCLVELLREPEDGNQQRCFYCWLCCLDCDVKVLGLQEYNSTQDENPLRSRMRLQLYWNIAAHITFLKKKPHKQKSLPNPLVHHSCKLLVLV